MTGFGVIVAGVEAMVVRDLDALDGLGRFLDGGWDAEPPEGLMALFLTSTPIPHFRGLV